MTGIKIEGNIKYFWFFFDTTGSFVNDQNRNLRFLISERHLLIPKVHYIDVFGTDLQKGENVQKRITKKEINTLKRYFIEFPDIALLIQS